MDDAHTLAVEELADVAIEVIDEGVTGFLVPDAEQASAAVKNIAAIDRAGCRTRARQRFSVDRMVADYLHVYATLLG